MEVHRQATTPRSGVRRQSVGDLLRRSAARTRNKTALVFEERRYTFGDLDDATDRLANALVQQGIAAGDHVAMLSRNNDVFVIARFALARLGAVIVPINFMLTADEIGYILGHAQISALFAEDTLAGIADSAIAATDEAIGLRFVIGRDGGIAPPGWIDARSLMQHADAQMPDTSIADDALAQILYTSGTESRPKGVMLSGRNLFANYMNCIVGGEMASDDIEVHPMPLYHCAQLDCFLTPDILLGATSIILPSADPARILETIETERATKLFCPPTVWLGLLQHPDLERRDISTLRKGYYGASIMPVEVVLELSRRLPGLKLYNFYGQTELAPTATILGPDDQLSKLGSAGRPALNVETRVVGDDDAPLPPGHVGEIVHRGANIMLGYWRDEDATADAFRNGWFHSGDLGTFDDEGYLSVVDRKKDMIKTGGENVASREVEEVVYQHPGVAQAAVFGIPHPRWIEAVACAIVLKPGCSVTPEQISAFLRERLAGYKAPKHIVLLEDLPKNATGKVLKRDLRERFATIALSQRTA